MPSASLSMLLFLFSVLHRLLLTNVMGLNILLSAAVSLGQLVLLLICTREAPSPTPDASVSRYSSSISS